MPQTVDEALSKARSIKIALSLNMGLSDYLINNNYLKKTHGETVPMVYALAMQEDTDKVTKMEEKLQKSIDLLTQKIHEQKGYNNNNGDNKPYNYQRSNSRQGFNNYNRNNNGGIVCRRCDRKGHTSRKCKVPQSSI